MLALLMLIGLLAACGADRQDDFSRRLALARQAAAPSDAPAPAGPLAPMALRARAMPLPASSGAITADELFDWAEASFPQLFPSAERSVTWSSYRLRYYRGTDLYLAVDAEGRVLALGTPTGGALLPLGMLGDFASPVRGWIGTTPAFREVIDAFQDPAALFTRTRNEARDLGLQVRDAVGLGMVMALDLDGDGRKELLLGLTSITADPGTLAPLLARLHVFGLGADGRFSDRTAEFIEGDAILRSSFGAGFAEDINLDGRPDIVFATNQEDGRNEDLGAMMNAYPVVLLSQPSGKYRFVSFGRPAWNGSIPTVLRDGSGEKLVVLANEGWRAYALRGGALVEKTLPTGQLDIGQLGGMFFRHFRAPDGTQYVVTTGAYPDVFSVRLYRLRPDLGLEPVSTAASGYQAVGTANFTTWQGSVYPVNILSDGRDFFVGGGGYGLDQACILKGEAGEAFRVLALGAIPRIIDHQPGRDPARVEERRVAFTYAFRDGVLQAMPAPIEGLDATTNRWGTTCEDLNGDGFDDIWVTVLRDGFRDMFPLIYLNQRDGGFRRVADARYPPVTMPAEQDNLIVFVAGWVATGSSTSSRSPRRATA